MRKNDKKDTTDIFSNKAIVGKPYLDIDRVIDEVKTTNATDTEKQE